MALRPSLGFGDFDGSSPPSSEASSAASSACSSITATAAVFFAPRRLGPPVPISIPTAPSVKLALILILRLKSVSLTIFPVDPVESPLPTDVDGGIHELDAVL